jgi:hypothetical protein
LFDEVPAFVERSAHLVAHRSGRFGDEADGEPRCPAWPDRRRASRGCVGEPVVQDRGDVVGVLQGPGGDQPRQQSVHVVVVGFRSA